MNKRSSLIMAHDILIEASMGSSKTNLVYRCNLNFRIVKTWLSRLIAKGLIEFYAGPSNKWKTTEKGSRFIEAMERVLWIWEDENIDQELKPPPHSIPKTISLPGGIEEFCEESDIATDHDTEAST